MRNSFLLGRFEFAFPWSQVLRHSLTLVPIVTLAILTGIAVGEGRWLLVCGLGTLPIFLVWPVQAALGLFAFLTPFEALTAIGGATGKTLAWFVGAAAASILLAIGLAGGRLLRPPREAVWWILFLIWAITTSLWALDSAQSRQSLPTACAFLILYVVAVSFKINKTEFETVVLFSVLGGVAASVLAAYQFHQGTFYGETSMRGSLVLGAREANPNMFAISLLLPLSLAMGRFFFHPRKLMKTLMFASAIVVAFAILLTMSRGAFLAVGVMMSVYLWRLRAKRSTIIALGVLSALLLAAPSLLFLRLQQASASRGAGRLDIWEAGLEAFKHNFLFGAGLNNFPTAYTNYAGYAPNFIGYNRDPHNIYLGVGVEFGSLGLLLLFIAIKSHLLAATKTLEDSATYGVLGCEAACWAVLAAGFFANALWVKTFWLGWILLAFATYLTKRAEVQHPITKSQLPA